MPEMIHPDPFSLRLRVGGTGDGKKWKSVAAIRGVPEVGEQYHQTLVVPFALNQIATFYTGESVWIKKANIWATQNAHFWIIAGNPNAEHQILGHCYQAGDDPADLSGYHIAGYFDVLAHGDGRTRALRLLKWWLEWEPTIPRRRQMAEHLGRMIRQLGMKNPAPFFQSPYDIELDEPSFNPAEWDIEIAESYSPIGEKFTQYQ